MMCWSFSILSLKFNNKTWVYVVYNIGKLLQYESYKYSTTPDKNIDEYNVVIS